MKQYLLLLSLLLGITLSGKSQTIHPTLFLKLFTLTNYEGPVTNINKALTSLSGNWRLIGYDEDGGILETKWHYKAASQTVPIAEFFMTTTDIFGKLRYKVAYNFLDQELYNSYMTKVSTLDGTKVTHSSIEDDGSTLTIYETANTAFIFRIRPVELTHYGRQFTRSYTVELYYNN